VSDFDSGVALRWNDEDGQSLEDLRMHRRRRAVDLKAMTGLHCRSSIAQAEQDIAAIKAGLETWSGRL